MREKFILCAIYDTWVLYKNAIIGKLFWKFFQKRSFFSFWLKSLVWCNYCNTFSFQREQKPIKIESCRKTNARIGGDAASVSRRPAFCLGVLWMEGAPGNRWNLHRVRRTSLWTPNRLACEPTLRVKPSQKRWKCKSFLLLSVSFCAKVPTHKR